MHSAPVMPLCSQVSAIRVVTLAAPPHKRNVLISTECRQQLGPIDHRQAASLLVVLSQQRTAESDVAATHALQLLARFAQQLHHSSTGGAAHTSSQACCIWAHEGRCAALECTQNIVLRQPASCRPAQRRQPAASTCDFGWHQSNAGASEVAAAAATAARHSSSPLPGHGSQRCLSVLQHVQHHNYSYAAL